MGGELLAPTGWARVHPPQLALCLKGTRPLSRLIPGRGSTPPHPPLATQSKSGQGSLKMADRPQGPQANRPPCHNSAPDASRLWGVTAARLLDQCFHQKRGTVPAKLFF